MSNKRRTIICAPSLTAEDRAEMDIYLAWYEQYQTDPANHCECGGMIWRVWAVRNRHDAGAYHCKRCKTAYPEPQMWRDREANQV